MAKILITGASGLLGQYLCNYFSQNNDVTGLYHSTPIQNTKIQTHKVDLTDAEATLQFFKSQDPDVVIHTAGLSAVDLCELYPDRAELQNVILTQNILSALNPQRTRFVQISTDHLFVGNESYYDESNETQPINMYARTKLKAEDAVFKYDNSVIVRTNFYGGETIHKKSFSSWIHHSLKNNQTIKLVDDVFFTPISVCSLAHNLEQLIQAKLNGIYNIVGTERVSKFEFAKQLSEYFGLNTELIEKSKVSDLGLKAMRPNDMSLSIKKVSEELSGFVKEDLKLGFDLIQNNNLL